MERQNIGLILAATDPITIAALRYIASQHSDKYREWKDTAPFLQLINDWFTVLSINSSIVEKRLNDTRRAVIRLDTDKILRNQFFWTIRPRNYPLNTKFTLDTMKSMKLTFSPMAKAVLGLLSFCKRQSLWIDYICTARLNSDHEEGVFDRWRQMSGTNYWTKARWFFEAERIIRTQFLVELSRYRLKDIEFEMEPAFEELNSNDDSLCEDIML